MGTRWMPVIGVALLLGGCAPQKEPPPAATTAKTVDEPGSRLTDDFGLPLVFTIEVPEVPPELQGPSPPIKEEPASR